MNLHNGNTFRCFHPNIAAPRYLARVFPIPKGLRPPAQGCEGRATLGKRTEKSSTPKGLRRLCRLIVPLAPNLAAPEDGRTSTRNLLMLLVPKCAPGIDCPA